MIEFEVLVILFFLGASSFTISTITGGGGAMTLLPILNFWLGPNLTAPILNLGVSIGRPVRLILFWKHIVWRMSLYYILPAVIGVFLASLIFINIPKFWFQIIIGVFLISTLFQYNFGKKKRSFKVKDWHFAPLGLVVGFLGTLTGGLGPVLNPFYLNAGLEKEELIATKTANSFFVGVLQVSSYVWIGIMDSELGWYGLALGSGIALGNVIGKRILKKISSKLFHQLFVWMMVISGVGLLIKALF